MTYPVDDAGNVRVDFVWGNFPLQPDQQRVNTGGEGENITTDGNWTVIKETGSSALTDGWDSLSFPTGDGGGERYQTFEWDNHEIATTGYSNYPSFIPNYSGDGDTGLERLVPNIQGLTEEAAGAALLAAGWFETQNLGPTYVGATVANDGTVHQITTGIQNIDAVPQYETYAAPEVPNVVGLTESAANSALVAAHVVKGAVTTANNAAGATALNDGKIKTQTPAAGTTVNTGASVALVKYAYTVTANTNIAGFSIDSFPGHAAPAGGTVYMFLTGRTTKPSNGNTITIANSNNSSMNRNWTVDYQCRY